VPAAPQPSAGLAVLIGLCEPFGLGGLFELGGAPHAAVPRARRRRVGPAFARIAQLPDHPVRGREEVAMNLKVIRLENVRLTTRSSVTGEG
jgi:hypothetical protein